MTYLELREKVEQQIAQLPLERLSLVSSFIDSIQPKNDLSKEQLRRLSPIKRSKKASDLLSHSGTWQGDDLLECLDYVRETRSSTQF
jgi:hypothetical protein